MPCFQVHNRCVEFEYIDAGGVLTHRKANINVCYRPEWVDFWYAEGFCHLRREKRTFRSDRMMRLWDGSTGWALIADPSAWIEALWLAAPVWHVAQEYTERSSLRAEEMDRYLAARAEHEALDKQSRDIVAQQFHGLRALIYVAKADKAFRAAEKRLFLMFFKRIAHYRMDAGPVEERALKFALEIDPPTTGQFHYSVRQVAQRGRRYRMAVCATAKAMINSDNKVSPYELEVLDYLVRKLKPLDD